MAASTVQNPPAQPESKSAKKKKAKAERTESPAPAASATPDKAASVSGNDASADDSSENPYIRELSKNIRNVNKKITNASKTDGLIAQHKGKDLNELVAQKIINADQKAQILKKPALQAQLAQLEEQLAQYKKVDLEYRTRAASEKAQLEKTLAEKYEKEKAEAISELKEKAEAGSQKSLHDSLLVLSQFLRLAAARRAEEFNAELDENLALEGVLLHVYSGDENAVSTILKLVQGSDEQTRSVSGDLLQTTFAQVKTAAIAHSAPLFQAPAEAEPVEAPVENGHEPQTDPTVAHATLTEIDTGAAIVLTNGASAESPASAHPANADVADGAANAAGESQWDTPSNNMSMSQEWVEVPRDPAETETGLAATPAAPVQSQSWADEQPEHPAEVPAPADPNDGFHQVQRNRGRNEREGGHRGRGGYRGNRGFRGDGRGGRGRGGRGGAPFRGPRRTEESQ
ncbi:uncharacterized protein E0L32_008842 [Thyridium curvatum]|uniref:YAG7-like dimerisation domain-containing protein n=1 Tax=Thyridium curvatum TaxID=1093900 RepID=A0A507AIJ7_9PEZI|nr:uncharacterized protein E0L32_008842 [Thyridium curvatum]TPX09995.1 hypothetical protein E0L32_008842 [Thyridium curvatum]